MANPKFHRLDGERRDTSMNWRYRISFERAAEPSCLFNAKTRVLVDANKALEKITGFSREELLDLRLEDLHPRSDRSRAIEHFKRFLGQDEHTYDDLPLETKEEGSVPVQVTG